MRGLSAGVALVRCQTMRAAGGAVLLTTILLLTLGCGSANPPAGAAGSASHSESGEAQSGTVSSSAAGAAEVAADLEAGRFARVRANFDATMLAALPEQKLASAWNQVAGPLGAFRQTGVPIYKAITPGYATYFVPMTFSQGSLEVQVVFNSSGQIAGLFLRPPGYHNSL